MAKSDYLEDKVLDDNVGTGTRYLRLYTSDPTDTGTGGTEVSGGSYAAQVIPFGAASGGVASNNATVTFPTATASWGTITHCAVWDALTAGNMLYHGAIGTATLISIDDIFEVASGAITITET